MSKKRKAANKIFQERVQYQNFNNMANLENDPDDDPFDDQIQEQQIIQQALSPVTSRSSTKPKPVPSSTPADISVQVSSEELQQESSINIRETGWLLRTVVVPPNAYVVHTRRGRKEPVTLGLGTSFRYRPDTDSYLFVPSAMQTIGIVAEGISKEKQGINILAYVQWMISDFKIAYQRLDFSNPKDPMGVVSAQLSEQAEAAIKDKISTMSVEEILADKHPIIEELTERMKKVAEGDKDGIGGLGVKIVTVQIKEAYVASQKLWEYLQAPFRNEREREARLSRLRIEEEVRQQELQNKQKIQHAEAQTETEIEKFQAQKQTESLDVVTKERILRKELENKEQETEIALRENQELRELALQNKLQEQSQKNKQLLKLSEVKYKQELAIQETRLEQERYLQQKTIEIETKIKELELNEKLAEYQYQLSLKNTEREELIAQKKHEVRLTEVKNRLTIEKQEQEHQLAMEKQQFEQEQLQEKEKTSLQHEQNKQQLDLAKIEQEIKNIISDGDLQRMFIERLPEIANAMPEVKELKVMQFGSENDMTGADLLSTYLSKIMTVIDHFKSQK